MPPTIRLLAQAVHLRPSPFFASSTSHRRTMSTTSPVKKWEGSESKEHITNENDKHNVQHDAAKEGKQERAGEGKGVGSRGTTGKAGNSNEKAKKDFPEAPDTIGMQDERGGKD